MKRKLLFLAVTALLINCLLNGQTLYVPGGFTTSGVGTSAVSGNVGIGTSTPVSLIHVFKDKSPAAYATYAKATIESNDHTQIDILAGQNKESGIYLKATNSANNQSFGGIAYFNEYTSTYGLAFYSGNVIRMRILENGNIGLGTNSPISKLSLGTGSSFNSSAKRFAIEEGTDGSYFYGIGGHIENPGDGTTAGLGLRGGTENQIPWNGTSGVKPHIFIKRNNGNVGIGTCNPQNALDVNGTIHAKEVKVDLTGWSDFVFHPTYQLKPLTEVEKFIQIYGHLQDIPSAAEVEKNGVNVGEMQKKLLQKVEENTLYLIELAKQIDDLKKQNELLKEENKLIKDKLSATEK